MSAPHLFLTGEMGVGKSTLLQRLLAAMSVRAGGFFTVRSREAFPPELTAHLLSEATGQTPSAENLLFFCRRPPEEGIAARFDRLGTAALQGEAELLVMDELGPRESEAYAFQQAVLRALDGETPVLGVLQRADSPFLRQVAAHPRVRVLEVTPGNREALAKELCARYAGMRS